MYLVREKRQQYVQQRKMTTNDNILTSKLLIDDSISPGSTTREGENKSDLYIPRATFSTKDIELDSSSTKDLPHANRKHRAGNTLKRLHQRINRGRSSTMKRIQFIVPSNQRLQKEVQKEARKHQAVHKMDAQTLQTLLQSNQLVNAHSNAPEELKRNIVKSVF